MGVATLSQDNTGCWGVTSAEAPKGSGLSGSGSPSCRVMTHGGHRPVAVEVFLFLGGSLPSGSLAF